MTMEPAAKAVLQNPSLLAEVFDYYFQAPTADSRGLTNHKSCLAAALTCKCFLSPALDVLWRELNVVRQLFKLIPGVTLVNQKLHSDKPISLAGIECLRGYARRVRYLHLTTDLNGEILGEVDSLILSQIQSFMSNKGESLFPCLQLLNISTHQDDDGINRGSPYLSLFVSPMLRRVNILRDNIQLNQVEIWPHRAPAFLVFIQALVASPLDHLKSFSTCLSLPYETLSNISKISSLEILSLDVEGKSYLSFQHFQLLAPLGRLRTLSLKLTQPGIASAPTKLVFSTLEDLTLHSDIQSTWRFFLIFQFPALKKLKTHLNLLTRGSSETYTHAFTSLARAAPRLVDLRLHSHRSDVYKSDASKSASLHISHFLALQTLPLEHLTMQNPRAQAMSNQDFSQLASAFPHLQTLNVQPKGMGTIDGCALLTVVSDLPNLVTLCLPVRLTGPLPSLPKSSTSRHNQLRTILFHAITDDPQFVFDTKRLYDIAIFLDTLFPNIRHLRNVNKMNDIFFKNLIDFVMGLQAARGRERDFIMQTDMDQTLGGGSLTLDDSQSTAGISLIDLSMM